MSECFPCFPTASGKWCHRVLPRFSLSQEGNGSSGRPGAHANRRPETDRLESSTSVDDTIEWPAAIGGDHLASSTGYASRRMTTNRASIALAAVVIGHRASWCTDRHVESLEKASVHRCPMLGVKRGR